MATATATRPPPGFGSDFGDHRGAGRADILDGDPDGCPRALGRDRTSGDLLNIRGTIAGKGAAFRSRGDPWADTTAIQGRLMLPRPKAEPRRPGSRLPRIVDTGAQDMTSVS